MPVDLKTSEWNSLKDQLSALVLDESLRDEIEKLFDYEVRRRFGETISRAATHTSEEQTFKSSSNKAGTKIPPSS